MSEIEHDNHILHKLEGTFGFPLSQGVGGAVELAPGYLKPVYDIVRKAGGVCIADEVQTGFGRTGSHYWGFETQGVVPDIVTMAKVIVLLENHGSSSFVSFIRSYSQRS